MEVDPPDYVNSPEWADVVPIPQNEGGPNPLAAIAYNEEYSTAMSYLRAVMAANELDKPRVFDITEHVISMNPAHYTVWLYRAAALRAQAQSDPSSAQQVWLKELAWLDKIATHNLKNYQIWHHRQVVVSELSEIPKGETMFLARILAKDAKNYHVWSYRQWLVRHFGLWPDTSSEALERSGPAAATAEGEEASSDRAAAAQRRGGEAELRFMEALLASDVRNNSAWNHRFFVLFGREGGLAPAPWVFDREIDFAQQKIGLAPQNVAAWNYLRGVVRTQKRQAGGAKAGEPSTAPADLAELEDFAKQYAEVDGPLDKIRSSHALELLADIWSANGDPGHARKALEILAEKLEPIRKGYWEYRMQQLPAQETAAV